MVEYRDLPSNSNKMKDIFHGISFKERIKFEEGASISQVDGFDNIAPEEISSAVSTLLVVTFVLLSVGPVLRNKGLYRTSSRPPSLLGGITPFTSSSSEGSVASTLEAQRRDRILKPEHLERFLYALPLYLRSLDKLQLQFMQRDSTGGEDRQPGYDFDAMWTPGRAEEFLDEADLTAKWPAVQLF
jgi:hypothetical protein